MITELLGTGVGLVGCAGYFSARYAWWRPAVDWSAARVLMYHMVRPHRSKARFNKLRVPPELFEKQLAWLKEREFNFIFASELFDAESLPQRTVCLTFDDGFADNLLNADPLLEKFDACATLYLVIDRDGGWSSKKKAHHADDELADEPKLSDEQVAGMVASGRWELGGHSMTHANLAAIDDESAQDEIANSRIELESRFGIPPVTFAYPFGIYEQRHARMVEEAGFRGAVTTEPGVEPLPYADAMQIPRIKVSGTEGLFAFSMRMRGGKRGLLK